MELSNKTVETPSQNAKMGYVQVMALLFLIMTESTDLYPLYFNIHPISSACLPAGDSHAC
jgi:hypothetical protein